MAQTDYYALTQLLAALLAVIALTTLVVPRLFLMTLRRSSPVPVDPSAEIIVAAAIQIEGVTLSLPKPARHPHVLYSAQHFTTVERTITATQGFLTSEGRFVNRVQGFQLAWQAKQIISDRHGPDLFSEDLW